MSISSSLLPEFDMEFANARKMLERVPEDTFNWAPHPKSMTVQGLVTHFANLPSWGVLTMKQDTFDSAPVGEEPYRMEPVENMDDALAMFDKNVSDARAAVEEADDASWMATWSFLHTGEVVFAMPRMAVYRSMIMNHMIHHRAQLGLYLRMNDIPVPSMYGPTADEQ